MGHLGNERPHESATILTWQPAPTVPEERRRALMGPGAPFEMIDAEVLGTHQTVFARRLPHLRALLEQGVTEFGDDPWLVHPGGALTYAQAASLIAAAAESLADMGKSVGVTGWRWPPPPATST